MMQQTHERDRLYHLGKPGIADDAAQTVARPATLPPGWIGLADCNISPVPGQPVHLPYVLLHPETGVALVDVAPAETAHAEAAFRSRLEGARFAAIFPGHLPVLHLSVGPGDFGRLAALLQEGFAALPPLSLPGGDGWVSVVRRALASRDQVGGRGSAPVLTRAALQDAEPGPEPDPQGEAGLPEPLFREPRSRRRLAVPVALGLAGLAGLGVAVALWSAPRKAAPVPVAATSAQRSGAATPNLPSLAGGAPPEAAQSRPAPDLTANPTQDRSLPGRADGTAPRPAPAQQAPALQAAAASPALPLRDRPAAPAAIAAVTPPVAAPGGTGRVMIRSAANLRANPDKNSAVLRVVPQGEVMREFSRAIGGWVQVGDAQPQGWIFDKLLTPARP